MSSSTESVSEESAGDAKSPPDPSAGATTTVHAERTVSAPVDRVWQTLVSREGTEALLGPGAVLGSKGESWHSGDGPHGVVRSFHPMEQIRVSWHDSEDAPGSLVDLHLVPHDGGTRLDLVHEKLQEGADTASLQAHWDGALQRVATTVTP